MTKLEKMIEDFKVLKDAIEYQEHGAEHYEKLAETSENALWAESYKEQSACCRRVAKHLGKLADPKALPELLGEDGTDEDLPAQNSEDL